MEIVITIDDDIYDDYLKQGATLPKYGTAIDSLYKALWNGVPLPKGHGKIGDLDAVMSDISTSINEMTNIGIAVDGEYLWGKLNDAIYNAPTIIEGSDVNDKT